MINYFLLKHLYVVENNNPVNVYYVLKKSYDEKYLKIGRIYFIDTPHLLQMMFYRVFFGS